uniref:Polyprotein protein n=1 Tax=Solanum tuberosum TaxID=4113 RepID=M1DHP3_SOLTU
MIFGTVEIPNELDMPLAITGDEVRVEQTIDLESEAETDEELLEVAEEASYEGLTETEEAMVDATVQASLEDTLLAAPSAATVSSYVTPGTEAESKLMHRELMPRQMERLYRQDPLFTSLYVFLYFDLWIIHFVCI